MSLAMATMRVRARQAKNRSGTKVKRLEKPPREDEIMLSLSKNIKNFVCVIYDSLQKLVKKSGSSSKGSKVKNNNVCQNKVKMIGNAPSDLANTTATKTKDVTVPKRKVSTPIPIPTRDRNGQRYPQYERKQLLYI